MSSPAKNASSSGASAALIVARLGDRRELRRPRRRQLAPGAARRKAGPLLERGHDRRRLGNEGIAQGPPQRVGVGHRGHRRVGGSGIAGHHHAAHRAQRRALERGRPAERERDVVERDVGDPARLQVRRDGDGRRPPEPQRERRGDRPPVGRPSRPRRCAAAGVERSRAGIAQVGPVDPPDSDVVIGSLAAHPNNMCRRPARADREPCRTSRTRSNRRASGEAASGRRCTRRSTRRRRSASAPREPHRSAGT